MKQVLNCLHSGDHHEAGCKAVYTVGVTMKRVQSFLHFGGHHEAGAKLFILWGSP